jgi:hypothetical protein
LEKRPPLGKSVEPPDLMVLMGGDLMPRVAAA